jgi:CHAT domain-containing protein
MCRLRRQRHVVPVGPGRPLWRRLLVWPALMAAAACSSTNQSPAAFEQAELALRRGALQEAQTIVDAAVAAEPSRDSAAAWRYQLLRAEILIARVDLATALPLLHATLPSGDGFEPLRARQKYLFAKTQVLKGAFPDALATLTDARRHGPLPRDLDWEAAVLEGQIKLRLGQWDDAEKILNAVTTAAAGAGDHYREALALNNLGMGRLVRRRFDEALTWFERLVALPGVTDTTVYGAALNNAGICYARLGQLERAVAVQTRAVEFHEKGSRVAFEQALGELGTTFLIHEDYPRGLEHLRRALTAAMDASLMGDAALWAKNLAAGYHLVGNLDEAEHFNKEARRLNPNASPASLAWNTLYDGHIAAGRGRREDAAQLYRQAMAEAGDLPAIHWVAYGGLADLAVANGQLDRAEGHYASALAIVESTRSDLLKADYRISFLTTLIDFYRRYVDLLVDRGKIERALEVVESSRARVLAERHGVAAGQKPSAAAMRRVAAQSRTVLLSYWLAPRQSYVWVVTAGGIRAVPLAPGPQIQELVRAYRSMLDNALADPLASQNTPGHRLYDMLVAPVAASIPEGASVLIVPDGALHQLNFETLPAENQYLIEKAEIQVAPSLALLSAQAGAPATGRSLLLMGDAQAREPEFPALRFASDEMTSIAGHFADDVVETLRGERALPRSYREAHPERFAMIHFTAHATANVDSPLDSAVILSGPDHEHKLYARDVADQPLKADLVTVSACRSAGERAYSGEGLIGFAWAFLRAGARRVIAGLWDVDDRSTAQLMDRVYAGIAAGAAPPRALRDAKLRFLREAGPYAKPYYWAPFQIFTVTL